MFDQKNTLQIKPLLAAGLTAFALAGPLPAAASIFVTPLNNEVEYGERATFVVLTGEGYTLSTSVDGTCAPGTWDEHEYTTGELINDTVDPVDCSVIFSATANTYTLTYNLQGGSLASPPQVPVEFATNIGTLPVPTRDGYRFIGWNTSASGDGFTWEDNATYVAAGDVDLYAIWEIVDVTPPEITALVGGSPFLGGEIQSLSSLTFQITDDIDSSPVITSMTLSGGPTSVSLGATWTHQGSGMYIPRSTALTPSDGAPYEIEVAAQDFEGNETTFTVSFIYVPAEIGVTGTTDGALRIPAMDHAFHRTGGGHAIDTSPLLISGQVLTGQHDVYAAVSSGSDIALIVNGIAVSPGQMVMVAPGYDFTASSGRVSLPVAAAQIGVAGDARLILSTDVDSAPVVSTTVRAWNADIGVSAPKWSVVQLLEPVEIDAFAGTGTVCRLARAPEQTPSSAITDPVCVVEWTSIPAETRALSASDSGSTPGIRGYAVETGTNAIAWTVWIYDVNGDRFELASGQQDLTVTPALGAVELEPTLDISTMYLMVQNLDTLLRRKSGIECQLTVDATTAKSAAARGNAATCLVEWTALPDGLFAHAGSREPRIRGMLTSEEGNVLSWRVSIFSQAGTRVDLNEQSYAIAAVLPPLPQVTFIGRTADLPGEVYAASMTGGYLMDTEVTSYNAALTTRLLRDGQVIDETVAPSGWSETNRIRRRINTDARNLWTATPYRIEAFYADLPSATTVREFSVLAVPSTNIRPSVQVEDTKALDIELLSVSTKIEDGSAVYNAATMGAWRTRVVMYRGMSEIVPLTEFVEVDESGAATFDVDLSNVGATSIRLAAQSELISPVEGYTRTVESSRPAYITILRGGAIDSSLSANRMSGEAPFSASITLDLSDRLDASALGEVKWQMKLAEEEEWQALDNASRLPTRLLHTFTKGTYWIRAIVENRHSGEKFVTPELEVVAYHRPKPDLSGPSNVFIGDTGRFTVGGGPHAEEPLVVQWSFDGGKTWADGELETLIQRDEAVRFTLVARSRYESAPAEDSRSWVDKRKTVNFVPVRPPRLQVIGPLRAEAGREQQLRALVRPPYQDMDVVIDGEWTLPDGSKATGIDLIYVPTEADVAADRITLTYTAWVVDYKDAGAIAEASRSTKVWKYVWPEFGLLIQRSSNFAPADFKVRLEPKGSARLSQIEGPEVAWDLPAEAEISAEPAINRRDFVIAQAGEFTLKGTITDARGNTATIEEVVTVLETPPYDVTIGIVPSNTHMRVPLEVRFRPSISGGHPRDRIMDRRYTLNGSEVESGVITITEPGSYEVALEATSRFGFIAAGTVVIDAIANQQPTCEIEARESGAYLHFYARCTDPDGRIMKHRWIINGSELSISGYRVSVRPNGKETTATLIGVDDSGAESEPVHYP